MRLATPLLLASILAGTASSAGANDALKRCRAIADSAARLSCYDTLPLEGVAAAPPASRGAPPAPGAPRAPAPALAPTPSPPTTASALPAPAASLESSFGMEGRAPAAELPEIRSHIPGTFYGWGQGSQITLANGQVWQVVDEGGRRMQLQDPKVRVRRGMMGAFYLEFEAHNHSPRVRRIR
jgi:hypothetical protein